MAIRRVLRTALGLSLCLPAAAFGLPAPGPLRFIAPTPGAGALVTTGNVSVRLDSACDFDTGTLAVTLNGVAIPAAQFLPFSSCSNGRMTSATTVVAITLPNGTITAGPATLDAGGSANFQGTGGGDGLGWNFDGGAAPATGGSVNPTFNAAGTFTVRLTATKSQGLAASGLSGGNLVTGQRNFSGGDPTPDTQQVAVAMPPDVDFVNFESGQVHPLALSASQNELYAVNTPEDRLAIFTVAGNGSLSPAGDVPVGVDPVSLAVRPGSSEVWVANHLSDTVSIVDAATRKLVATLAVGDEPTDVVFASGRAFVTLAGNEDRVRVYNAATRALVTTIDLFGDDPRALAANAAGTEVYAVVLESGNGSTALFHELVSSGGGPPPPSPPRAGGMGQAPNVGLIVQFNPATGDFEDEVGDDWSSFVDFTIADDDVFVIDADAGTPTVTSTVKRVGTTLFDVAVHPSGQLWIPNTDSRNLVRFEPNLRGHLVETRVSRVTLGGGVTHVDLNPHIDYGVTPGSSGEIATSLALPGDGVFNAAGTLYYLTALGSRKVGVLDANAQVVDLIDVGEGPSGVALKESADRLYVLNRFSNTLSVVDTTSNTEIATIGVAGPSGFDPSPDVIKDGRRFLYDAQLTSGHGDIACATCHTFGNFDNIAWDLGNPQGTFVDYDDAPWATFAPLGPSTNGFDPMKGPMTTQTLRGLENLEPFHWRGDRQNFQAFNPAFVGLMGRDTELSGTDMDAYTDFIMTVRFPPNPFRNLDDSLPTSITVVNKVGGGPINANPNSGAALFTTTNPPQDAGVFSCAQCHALPTGSSTNLFNGSAEGETQDFKIPHNRNMYEKEGFNVIRPNLQSGNGSSIGPATVKRGFGFLHDGSVSLAEFLSATVFVSNDTQERQIYAFMMAFPTETKPAVGRQLTVTAANKSDAQVITTIGTLTAQALAGNCDLIVKGVVGGTPRGYLYDPVTGQLYPDSIVEPATIEAVLRANLTGSDVITYTGVPPGAGVRLGIDRDRDTWLDRTETTLGTDPADPHSNPWGS